MTVLIKYFYIVVPGKAISRNANSMHLRQRPETVFLNTFLDDSNAISLLWKQALITKTRRLR